MRTLACSRALSFAKEGESARDIVVGVGMPYEPEQSLGGERFAGCAVCLGSPQSLHEVYAGDALHALGLALVSIDAFLTALCEAGELRWPDGRRYDARRDNALAARLPFRCVSEALAELARKRVTRA